MGFLKMMCNVRCNFHVLYSKKMNNKGTPRSLKVKLMATYVVKHNIL